MLQILIIIFYSIIFCFIIARIGFFKVKGLSASFICIAFLIKLTAGILYGYLHRNYLMGGDTMEYYLASDQIANTFFQYPLYYLKSWLFMNPDIPSASVYIYPDWAYIQKDYGTYLLSHVHAIPQFFSFGYYNVHIVFVAFLALLGSLNIYRALSDTIHLPKNFLIFACFFMPSVLFWTAGLHKDVWVYLGISLLLLGLRKLYLFKKIANLEMFAGILIIAVFRYYLIPLIVPGILAMAWSVNDNKSAPLYKFLAVYSIFALFLFSLEFFGLYPLLNILAERQAEFLNEMGNSSIQGVQPLVATWSNFFLQIPRSIVNVCFRPFIWDCNDVLQLISSLEILVFWIFAIFSISFRRTESKANPLSYFIFFYAASNLLLVGLLVSNVGTIVRYRSIALSLLFVVALQAFDFIKLGLQNRKTNKASSFKAANNKRAALKSQL